VFRKQNTKGEGDTMNYDYSKLNGRMAELGISKQELAKSMNIGRTTLYKKLCSDSQFTQTEIGRAIKLLGLQTKDIPIYFFSLNVLETKQKDTA
jgi:predicted transcriptional regulator